MIHLGSLLALLLCVVGPFSLAAALPPPPLATVQQTMLVARGSGVDLRPALTFNLNLMAALGAECRVTNIDGSSCGQILPSIFDCTTYSGPILYQHFGCFTTKELATFMVSALTASNSSRLAPRSPSIQPVHISTHTVEVIVGPPHPLLAALCVEPVHTSPESEVLNLTMVFPPAMVGWCYYEVLSVWPMLSLPIAGTLEGAVNQLLPSGYVQNSSLTYQPHNWTTDSYTDYVLVKIYNHKSMSNFYAILPFRVGLGDSGAEVSELSGDILVVIHQVVNTPVNFTHSLPDMGSPSLLLRYTFPILDNGYFRSVHSSAVNVTTSTFTNVELLTGQVAFYPTYSLDYSFTSYSCNITNVAGILIARGEVGVLANELGDGPSQRKNLPLVVAEGGTAAINQSTIDFYLFRECALRTTIQVSRPPVHGELVYSNGSSVGTDKIPFWQIRNTSLLIYRHSADAEQLGDVIYWKVECPFRHSLRVFMSVLVAAVDDALPTLRIQSHLMMYRDWALPISPSSLQAADADSAHQDIHFHVHSMGGTLLRASRRATDFENTSVLFPLIAFNSLVPIIGRDFSEVMNFSLWDLEQQAIWYIPSTVHRNDWLELTVGDSANGEDPNIYTLFIDVSPLAPNHTLVISTSTQYPYVLQNRPLPLSNEGHMFLTPYFLYSRAPPSPPKDMRYLVQAMPQGGRLCFAHSRCTESVREFTQQDINYHRLVYRPDNSSGHLTPDQFTFLATVQGVPHISPLTHTFIWTVVTQTTLLIDKQFWIKSATERVIPPKFFRPFSSRLGSRELSFHVREQPQYGNLMVRNSTHLFSVRPSYFTWQDVLNRWLWYVHFQHRGPPLCSDQLLFDAVSPLGNITGRLPILLRRGEMVLSVATNPHFLQGLTQFTFSSKDLNVSSSFCPEFVTFTVARQPLLGTLRLRDHVHNTQRELLEGSNFTAKDVLTEAVSYSFSGSEIEQSSNITDEFTLRASDPSSQWPPEGQEGDFTITITPSPQAVLEVNFSTHHPVTWLPSHQSYGYALSSRDIQLLNTSLQPREVLVQVEKELRLGRLEKQGAIISFFTAADLQEGSVVYLKNLHRLEAFRERIKLGVYAYLPGFSRRAGLNQFLVEWAIVGLEHGTVTVSEHQDTLQLSIRRRGAMWFESRVRVVTVPGSAASSPDGDCPPSPSSRFDYCHMTQEVVFQVGVVTQEVTIQLIDDQVAEGQETFYVQLVEGEGLTNAILHGNVKSKINIEDTEDYNNVFILGQADLTNCLSVQESSGNITINLTRLGNLEQEVGVVCYTESDTAEGDADYVSRRRGSLGSEVIFGMNQSMAECVVRLIDDRLFETGERFFVHLDSSSRHGFINIDPSYSSICVYISYAEDDSPVVSFNETQVFVRESETQVTYATFTLDRHGDDLNTTSLVNYIPDLNEESTAMENVDFRLYSSDECSLDGERNGGGCVSFSPGQTRAELRVEILPDTVLEGNEVFYLKIVYVRNGMRTRDHLLFSMTVTIIDGAQPTYIEFVDTSTVLYEVSGHNDLAVRRRGYIQGTVVVKCILKGITASGGFQDDFLVPPRPQNVTFHPGDTEKSCSVYLLDDTLYEGLETFSATLELVTSSDPGVILSANHSTITVSILDLEDSPVVSFGSAKPIHQPEPLSNSSLDMSIVTLTVVRTGDLSVSSRVWYTAVDGSARAGQDYALTHGVIVFERGQAIAELAVPILANHLVTMDTNFTIQLSLLSESTNDPTSIGTNSTVTVVIDNRELLGVYFPSLPQLCNVEEGGRVTCTPGVLYFDLPLLCITPCDSTFDPAGNEDCQGIVNEDTVYMWEVSTEPNTASFHPIHFDSVFTSTVLPELQTTYLQPDLLVRCTAQAVDHAGVRGYSRTSVAVQLSRQRYECSSEERVGGVRGRISTYDGFMGADEDVVQVELTVSAFANFLPVVSTVPLSSHTITRLVHSHSAATPTSAPTSGSIPTPSPTSDSEATPPTSDSEATPLCSTLNLRSGYSLLTHEVERVQGSGLQLHFRSLYHHLDRSRCEWRFSAWYSIRGLVEECGGYTVGGAVSLTVIPTYLQFQMNGTVIVHTNQSSIVVSTDGLLPSLSPPGPSNQPLHILPDIGPPQSYIFPLSISRVAPNGHVQLVLYMTTPANTTILPSLGSEQPDSQLPSQGSEELPSQGSEQPDSQLPSQGSEELQLLFTSAPGDSHVWQLQTHRPGSVRLGFIGHSAGSCMQCEQEYLFSLPLSVTADGRGEVSLDTEVTLLHSHFTIGEDVRFTASLSKRQQLQGENVLQLQQLYLCEQVGQDNCSNRLTIMGASGTARLDLHVKRISASIVSVEFPTDRIILLSSPSLWFLHIHLGLSMAPLSRVSAHPFTLLSPSPLTTTNTTTPATSTETTPPPSQDLADSAPTYAAIGVLTSVVLVLLLCVGVLVGVACMTKGKASFQEKTSAIGKDKDLCEELNSKRGLKNSYQYPPAIKRPRSTTGFPTCEGLLKTIPRKRGGRGNAVSSSNHNLHKSQSLPSILPPHIIGKSITPLTFSRQPPASMRRANPRGHTRVKKLNRDIAEQSWAADQLKGNRELTNLQVVQDLVLKRNKYGVNEIQGPQQSTGPYARYVVTSIAASAKTPEPGSTPVTKL